MMDTLEKLKKNYQFKKIYNEGRYYAEEFLVLYVIKNRSNINKIGYSVSKKIGNSVKRNRVRRLLRENFRKVGLNLKTGHDMIFTARASSSRANYKDIERCMLSALKRARILKEEI